MTELEKQMQHVCVVGLNWGDEGKGKIVDVLASDADAVVRYQGGANAGHTVYIGEVRHVLHHLPMGVLHDGILAVLGNGMVLEPHKLLDEVESLPEEAVSRIRISDRAHVVLPHHQAVEKIREQSAAHPIGTTLRGIGPAYQDKFGRDGIRMGDIMTPGFIEDVLPEKLRERTQRLGIPGEGIDEAIQICHRLKDRLESQVTDTRQLLHKMHQQGKKLLFEGAQGCMLDIDFGTYPFVTSSSPSFLGLGPGTGFSPRKVDHVVGVTKAYCTRVGEGPFPSEIHGEEAEALREAGGEFGTTTGRPRRVGWLDIPALRFAVDLNDLDSFALTKADVLDGWETIPVVTAYRLDGETLDQFPDSLTDLEGLEPVIEQWPGWSQVDEVSMRPFIDRLRQATGIPVSILSTGRRRDEVCVFEPFRAEGELA
ncbi:MAG: adenylosuccinate synthase [Planctomycetota bacterium]|nr:adenylosuccinate synthase [Planctomycetota bacterium]